MVAVMPVRIILTVTIVAMPTVRTVIGMTAIPDTAGYG